MTDIQIHQLPPATTLDPADTLALDQADATRSLTVAQIDARYAGATHGHTIAEVTGLQTALSDKSASGHVHAIAEITNLQTALDGKSANGHGHAIAEITNLQTALDGKSANGHGHTIADLPVAADGASNATALVRADDSRLTDARAPTPHSHALAEIADLATTLADSPHRNLIINGCCRVAHRAAKPLGNDWQVGQVDLIAVRATGTVSGGDIRQEAVASLGSTGQALKVHGLATGAGSTLAWRVRIEARDARRLAHRPAVLSCVLYSDVGPIDWHLAINTANAADGFAAVTPIGSGTHPAVPAHTEAVLSLAIADMGACANGIEAIITADIGATAGNNVYLTDLQLEPGTARTAFAHRPISIETTLVHRYLRPCTGLVGKANGGSSMQIPLSHPGLRAAPAYEATAPLAFTDAVTADFTQSQASVDVVHERDADKGRVTCGFFSGMASGTTMIQRGTGGVILASAEL